MRNPKHAPTARAQFVEKFETSQRRYEPRGANLLHRLRCGGGGIMSEKISGVCKVWRGEYGFLLADDGRAVFLHYRECERCGIRPPKAGDKLKFEIERGRKGLRAIAVSYV